MKGKIVVGVAGMPGAGKATVKEIVERVGYPVVAMGDVIREETRRRGMELTPGNMGMIMLKLREEEGPAIVAKRCIPKIEEARGGVVVVDGIRSLHEVDEFKRRFSNFVLIAIHASPETRFQRLFRRRRSDDPEGWETFMERDLRELKVGSGEAIATADHIIINEGTKGQLKNKVLEVLGDVMRRWMK